MIRVYVGLGSNLDEPVTQVRSALDALSGITATRRVNYSSLYRSAPLGPADQPDYVNAVLRIKTCLAPLELLKKCQSLENTHGRKRTVHWGARTLDLDILLYQTRVIDLPDLKVPHPELTNRAFVLYPLADVAPSNLIIPNNGSLASLLAACPAEGLHKIEL